MPGKIESFGLKNKPGQNSAVVGTGAWVKYHLCNMEMSCCTSNQFFADDIISGSVNFEIEQSDQCYGQLMRKDTQSLNAQLVELKYSGPVDFTLDAVNIFLSFETALTCYRPGFEDVLLPGGVQNTMVLKCYPGWRFA